ncbi:hypothetical protein [Vibrio cyclitrophicus]|uniref:hypothetical protein n=1 Tax=Vibrio cyclitrophicus TaxID=47951 RepID=UPI0036F1F882
MNKSYVITPDKYPIRVNTDKYPIRVNTDRDHDGGTVGSLHKSEDGIKLQCDFERTYSLEFVISTQGKGLNLSTFDSDTSKRAFTIGIAITHMLSRHR